MTNTIRELVLFIGTLLVVVIRGQRNQFGTYCGAIQEHQTPGKTRHYNCKGVVWAMDSGAFVVEKFSFQPSFFLKENVTFWAGPAKKSDDRVKDMFPSENGFYLHPEPIKDTLLAVKPDKYIVARQPSSEEVSEISLKSRTKEASYQTEKLGPSNAEPEPSSKSKEEPHPEPEPGKNRRRRQAPQQIFPQSNSYPFQQSNNDYSNGNIQQIPADSAGNFFQNLLPSLGGLLNSQGSGHGTAAQNQLSNVGNLFGAQSRSFGVPRPPLPTAQNYFTTNNRLPSAQSPGLVIPQQLSPTNTLASLGSVFGTQAGIPGYPNGVQQSALPNLGSFLGGRPTYSGYPQQPVPTQSLGQQTTQSLLRNWLPDFLTRLANSPAGRESSRPISLSLFSLRDLFNPAPTTTSTSAPTTAPDTAAATSTLPITTPYVALSTIRSHMVRLIVDGGIVTVPPNQLVQRIPKDFLRLSPVRGQPRVISALPNVTLIPIPKKPVDLGLTVKKEEALKEVEPTVKMDPLSWHAGFQPLMLKMPKGRSTEEVQWLSVWDHTNKEVIASLLLPRGPGFQIPGPTTLKGLKPAFSFKDVRSGPIEILDSKTIIVRDFYFEGDAPGAWFMVGKSLIPSPMGKIVPILRDHKSLMEGVLFVVGVLIVGVLKEDIRQKYDCDFLKPFYNQTVTLKLPGNQHISDVFWLSVFCVPYAISFSHIYLPYADLAVPPNMAEETVPYCILE